MTEGIAYDDLYHLNTQSGTQWDGFRHFAHIPTGSFYNGTKGSDIVGPAANHKCSIHHWAEHGVAGRGILLDYRGYAHKKGINYDPYDYYPISWEELYQCGKDQGVDIRPAAQGGDIKVGDMLFIRSGWKEAYDSKSDDDRTKAATRHGPNGENDARYAGVSQEQKILDWLHDCYFASVAGDAPAFEAWPTHEDYHLHEYSKSLSTLCAPFQAKFYQYWLSGACRWARCWTWRSWRRLAERRIDGSSSSQAHPQIAREVSVRMSTELRSSKTACVLWL